MPENFEFYTLTIPACVAQSDVSASAKLLFGGIFGLTRKGGYCWATNAQLAEAHHCSPDSASRLVTELQKAGFLRLTFDTDPRSGATIRYIYPQLPGTDQHTPLGKNADTPLGKNADTPLGKNADTPLGKNADPPSAKMPTPPRQKCRTINKEEYIKEKSTRAKRADALAARPDIESLFQDTFGADEKMRQRIKDFLDGREDKGNPMPSARAARAAIHKLLRYSDGGNRVLVEALMDKAIEGGWDSFYPLHDDERAAVLSRAGAQPPRKVDMSGVRCVD